MKIKPSFDQILFQILAYFVVGGIGFVTLFPFLVLLGSSFASEHEIITSGYTIFPKEFSIDAYKLVFLNPQKILRAYGITISLTSLGTLISLFFSSMAAYVLYRKDVKYRNALAFFLYFTTLFQGGLAPYYIIVSRVLHLKNTPFVLLLVPMFQVFHILILRNYLNSIPDSLFEAAKIDGAGDFAIFIRVILPLSKPALAAVGLFTALIYWNDWWTAMMFVEKDAYAPLQFVLYQILSSVNVAANMVNNMATIDMPKESLKLAMTVISTGPILLLYPFVQKYFVKGITMGAVKG
ncbi:binding-protein-dependent transport systems inner membrane component [Candidatus Moduliflexus flocculans]|uniref:Binding-protein-dependent transport systems inner membrane component n=1 Tax=Candidatus Moduliflexus flocculans TaxID=1499966 RepID=A0A081BQA4_9BACT|nr:binding-protein-dependent transport systems inner membrane component [Candidatus Moduliflexus flocculans]